MALTVFEARYFDGVTAKPHQVTVELYGACLRIEIPGSAPVDWRYRDIQVLDQPVSPQPAKLTTGKERNARLYIEPEYWAALKTKLPSTAFPTIRLATSWKALLAYTGLSLAFVFGAVSFGPGLFEQASGLIPRETEVQIGKMALASSIDHPVCIAPQGHLALQKMVDNLKQGMTRDVPVHVRVVSDDETLNALAAPGGQLILFSGIIRHANSAEEVAGVLAHEMAHVEMNHPMKSLMRHLGVSFTLQMMLGDTVALGNTAQFAGMLNHLHYSRKDELEADKVGFELLEKANIDPSGLTLFFERVKQMEAKNHNPVNGHWGLDDYFSTHPPTAQRIHQLTATRADSRNYRPLLDQHEWRALRAICTEQADLRSIP